MNTVQLLGRICNDIDLRQTQSGIATCRFTIAVQRNFKNKATGEYETDFISCIAWKNTAEFISRYWSKGKRIAVTGALRTGSYQDRNHPDVTHYTTDLMVDNAYFCEDKNQPQPARNLINQAQSAGVQAEQTYTNLSDFEEILSDGDTPF